MGVKIKEIFQGKMILHYGDLIDGNCLVHIINTTKPTEIYNLGAQSHVKVTEMNFDYSNSIPFMKECWIHHFKVFQKIQVSFDLAEYTAEVDGVGTLRLLDAIR